MKGILIVVASLALTLPATALALNDEPPPEAAPNPCGYYQADPTDTDQEWDYDLDTIHNCLDPDYTWAPGHIVGTHPNARPPASTQPANPAPTVDGGNDYVPVWSECRPIVWRGRTVKVSTIDFRCAVARPWFARYLRTSQTGAWRCSRLLRAATCDGVKDAAVRGRW